MQIDIEAAVEVLRARVADDAIVIGFLQQQLAIRDAENAELKAAQAPSPEVTRSGEGSASPVTPT